MHLERTIIGSHGGSGYGSAWSGGSAPLPLIALAAVFGSFACRPGGHVEVPAQPPVSGDLAAVLSGAQLAQYRDTPADDNRLGDTPARADDESRLAAQLASETGMAHINDVARRVRYNGAYFEIDIEVNRERGVVPVTWDMLRAHTPLARIRHHVGEARTVATKENWGNARRRTPQAGNIPSRNVEDVFPKVPGRYGRSRRGGDGCGLASQAYYARVYTSRGWANGRQAPSSGPGVILPEAFTPELTPELFEYFKRSFMSWNRNIDGWTQAMAEAWLKTAAIHVARAFTPESVGGVAVISARASQITGRTALGAAAVPNAAVATRACVGGRCLPAASIDKKLLSPLEANAFGALFERVIWYSPYPEERKQIPNYVGDEEIRRATDEAARILSL